MEWTVVYCTVMSCIEHCRPVDARKQVKAAGLVENTKAWLFLRGFGQALEIRLVVPDKSRAAHPALRSAGLRLGAQGS